MYEFFAATLSFPTVVFTVLLLVAVAYWGLVILGALGIDIMDFDADGAADGAAEGAMEGAAEGAAEAAVEGAAEAAAEGAAEAAAEGAAEGATEGAAEGASQGLAGALLSAIRVKNVPVTVVLTLVVFYGWLVTHLVTLLVLLDSSFDSSLIRGALFVGAGIAAIPLANLSARPLSGLGGEESSIGRKDLIGKVVRVDTSRVNARFGSGTFDDGAGGMILHIRCDDEANTLSRGSQALIVSWDEAREAYEVTPFDDLLDRKALPKNS